jgi:hypothetical protein
MVVGMHRSGTSAVANSVFELGVRLPTHTEIVEAAPSNANGHWEPRDLAQFDETLLRYLGGSWSAPPIPVPGWEDSHDPAFVSLRSRAGEIAARCFAQPPMVLKDPRLCLTLPLWRKVLAPQPCAVLVVRDPLDVAKSLQVRDQFPLTLGLAIWARYIHQSVKTLAGMPVFALEYGPIFEDPLRRIGELAEFLTACGVDVSATGVQSAANVFEENLRHHHNREADYPEHHRQLLEVLARAYGAHEQWSPPVLPEEPQWVSDVLSLAAAGQAVTAGLQMAQTELKWIKRSRLFRTSRAYWRVTGTGPVLSSAPYETGEDQSVTDAVDGSADDAALSESSDLSARAR